MSDAPAISVVLRTHAISRLPYLRRALFALMVQSIEVEVLIVTQRFTRHDLALLEEGIRDLVSDGPGHMHARIINVGEPEAGDIRQYLLNAGIREATHRFLAFLDDDDLVYSDMYETLIEDMRVTNAALAFGRCLQVHGVHLDGAFLARAKVRRWQGSSLPELVINNFAPIHSYVFDRTRIARADLQVDHESPYLEDYRLLLRLATKYKFAFRSMEQDLCEYWMYESKENTTTQREVADSHVSIEWRRAEDFTHRLKSTLTFSSSQLDFEIWARTLMRGAAGRAPDGLNDSLADIAEDYLADFRFSPALRKDR